MSHPEQGRRAYETIVIMLLSFLACSYPGIGEI